MALELNLSAPPLLFLRSEIFTPLTEICQSNWWIVHFPQSRSSSSLAQFQWRNVEQVIVRGPWLAIVRERWIEKENEIDGWKLIKEKLSRPGRR